MMEPMLPLLPGLLSLFSHLFLAASTRPPLPFAPQAPPFVPANTIIRGKHDKNTKSSMPQQQFMHSRHGELPRNGHAVKGSCDLAKSNESP